MIIYINASRIANYSMTIGNGSIYKLEHTDVGGGEIRTVVCKGKSELCENYLVLSGKWDEECVNMMLALIECVS